MEKIIVISGPTASGKSSLAFELAKKLNGCIINADSMQIYKGLPILSAQPSQKEQELIEHRLYSVLEPKDNNSVYVWLKLVEKSVNETLKNNKIPIIVGGTGMYISRLINGIKDLPTVPQELRNETIKLFNKIGYDEFYNIVKKIDNKALEKLNKNDKQRLMRIYEIYQISGNNLSFYEDAKNNYIFNSEMFFHINLNIDREILYERCKKRFELIFNEAKQEVNNFLENYNYVLDKKQKYSILSTLGLSEFIKYNNSLITENELVENTIKITRHYAKRQCTWFRNQFEKLDYIADSTPNENNVHEIIKLINLL